MASGTKHLNANVGFGLTTLLTTSVLTMYSNTIQIDNIYLAIGLLLGTIITPDYDFNKIYIKKLIKKIPVLGFFWNLYWYPYSLLFKHRGISHNLILGTITRVIYLCLPLFIYILYAYHNKIDLTFINNIDLIKIIYMLSGWYIQDFIHYILDSKLFKNIFLSKDK